MANKKVTVQFTIMLPEEGGLNPATSDAKLLMDDNDWKYKYFDEKGEETHMGACAMITATAMGLCTIMDNMIKKGWIQKEAFWPATIKQFLDLNDIYEKGRRESGN